MKRLALLLLAGAAFSMNGVAGASLADAPELTDAAGDANFINNQGSPADPGSVDTRPGSVDGVDLRSISFDTAYTTTKLLRADGTVSAVTYTPTALLVTATMEGNILPTAGPSMGVRVPVSINGCEAVLQSWWKGENAVDGGVTRTDLRKATATCPGGAGTVVAGLGQTISGKTVTMRFPFTAFAGAMQGFIADGVEIAGAPTYLNSQNNPYTTPQQLVAAGGASVHFYATPIDMTARFTEYTIGSDVPADVSCDATPDHPDCVA